ncbi:MAG: DUF5683 domain-containing protein [Flavobacteriales bacterium]|nr:DUF5683 domain-containing protein [Flavobacteriales bacterium]
MRGLATTLILLASLSLWSLGVKAQPVETSPALEQVQRATNRSAMIPGWGQATNGKWWKVPLVYGGFAACAWSIDMNGTSYRTYRDGYWAMVDDDPATVFETEWSVEDVKAVRDGYRSNLELSCLMVVVTWGLQVMDAHIDAHLAQFDVSEDLSLNLDVLPMRVGVQHAAGPCLRVQWK